MREEEEEKMGFVRAKRFLLVRSFVDLASEMNSLYEEIRP